MREPIGKFFQCSNDLMKAFISTRRIDEFLSLDEVESPAKIEDSVNAVTIDGNFSWERGSNNQVFESKYFTVTRYVKLKI